VQKFLGLINYYRRFIKGFAKIAAPLHVLVRKTKVKVGKGAGRNIQYHELPL